MPVNRESRTMADPSDIEKRLRAGPTCITCGGSGFRSGGSGYGDVCGNCIGGRCAPPSEIEIEAADEIARLRQLMRYVTHWKTCVTNLGGGHDCSCGLDAARARTGGR